MSEDRLQKRGTSRNLVRFFLTWSLAFACASGAPLAAQNAAPLAGFISPVSNPVNFEDPRARSEIRTLYVYHKLSDQFASGFTNANELPPIGGDAHVVAVQARVAVTDRLALIATKDGYVWLRPENVLTKEDGWANIAFGAKYSIYRDPERGALATVGLRYETPSGNTDVFQGQHPVLPNVLDPGDPNDPSYPLAHESHGDGILNPFLSAGWGTAAGPGNVHLLTYTALRLPISGYDSTFFDLSLHADYEVDTGPCGKLYPLIEFNWVQTLDGGRRLPIDNEGFDFFNFGTTGSGGRGVVTGAVGFRYRILEGVGDIFGSSLGADLGAVYELPLTDREDLFGWRVTTDLTLFLM